MRRRRKKKSEHRSKWYFTADQWTLTYLSLYEQGWNVILIEFVLIDLVSSRLIQIWTTLVLVSVWEARPVNIVVSAELTTYFHTSWIEQSRVGKSNVQETIKGHEWHNQWGNNNQILGKGIEATNQCRNVEVSIFHDGDGRNNNQTCPQIETGENEDKDNGRRFGWIPPVAICEENHTIA